MPRMTVFVKGNTKTYYFIFNGCIEDVAGWRKDGLKIIILNEEVDATDEEADFLMAQKKHDEEIVENLLESRGYDNE